MSDRSSAPNSAQTRRDAQSATALTTVLTEAQRTLDAQLETLQDIDDKALQLVQYTTGVLALVVSALSFVGSTTGVALNPYLGGGVLLMVAGTAVAGVTYTASTRIAGIGPDDLELSVTAPSEATLKRVLVESYADWVRYNTVTNLRAAVFITTAVLLVVAGTIGLALGTLRIVLGPLPPVVLATVALVFGAATATTGLHRQLRRLWAVDRPDRPVADDPDLTDPDAHFDGQATFKGESRDDPT